LILKRTTTFGASPPSLSTAKYSGTYYLPDKLQIYQRRSH